MWVALLESEKAYGQTFQGDLGRRYEGLKTGKGQILNQKEKGLTGSCRSFCDFYTKQDQVPGQGFTCETGGNWTGGEEKKVEGLGELSRFKSLFVLDSFWSWIALKSFWSPAFMAPPKLVGCAKSLLLNLSP